MHNQHAQISLDCWGQRRRFDHWQCSYDLNIKCINIYKYISNKFAYRNPMWASWDTLACLTPLIKTHTFIQTRKTFRGLLKMSQGLVICFALPATHIIWAPITKPHVCTAARLLGMPSVWQSKPGAGETPQVGSFTIWKHLEYKQLVLESNRYLCSCIMDAEYIPIAKTVWSWG